MYLKVFTNSVDVEAQGEFNLALVTDDFPTMLQWAGRFVKSIKTGTLEVFIPDEETIRDWERKSLQFLQEERGSQCRSK
jgi:hypothetical protein